MRILRRLAALSVATLTLNASFHAQTAKPAANDNNNPAAQTYNNEVELKRLALLGDLQALAADASKLDKALAQALAKAEIADAAWLLDQTWARQLLREAYAHTLPGEEELSRRREEATGQQVGASLSDMTRDAVRFRVLEVAGRDRALADELARLGREKLQRGQVEASYAALTDEALKRGDTETAGRYIEQSLEVDPTQMNATLRIIALAAQDRAAADSLILKYIEALRASPFQTTSHGALRTYVALNQLVFPGSVPADIGLPQRVAPPGAAVMRAYVSFMLESLGRLEQNEPGSLQRLRSLLINVWPILRQHAPELTATFQQLEAMSRRPGESAALPEGSIEKFYKERQDKRVKEGLNSDKPDEAAVHTALNKGDFAGARRMIDKLDDGARKASLLELTNWKEAVSLAQKGDIAGAQRLAQQLTRVASITQAYPAIVSKCASLKDQTCAADSVYRAIRQLENASAAPPAPPQGMPSALVPTNQEFDPLTVSLSKLAKAIAPINTALALEVLDEMVKAANRSSIDTEQGRTGLETDVFRRLAAEDETRVEQAASSLKQRLPRIAALAAIYQWKAEEWAKQSASKAESRKTSGN